MKTDFCEFRCTGIYPFNWNALSDVGYQSGALHDDTKGRLPQNDVLTVPQIQCNTKIYIFVIMASTCISLA
jgi:hypothetical protein